MPTLGAVAEDLLDPPRLVVQAQDDFVDLRHLLQQVDLVVEKRPVEDRNDRLRRVDGERPEPRALAPGEKDRLHDNQRSYTMVECASRSDEPAEHADARAHVPRAAAGRGVADASSRAGGFSACRRSWSAPRSSALASITDWLDGYLARRRRQVTWLGQMLDPIADKLLTSAAFISLVQLGLAPAWMVALIIGREFAITGLRSLAYTKGITIPASPLGKIKMASQVTAILLLILGWGPLPWLAPIGYAALWVVMLAAVVSAVDYYRRFQRAAERARHRRQRRAGPPGKLRLRRRRPVEI